MSLTRTIPLLRAVSRPVHRCPVSSIRHVSNSRPGPPPLPRDEQREFEELQRQAQTPLAGSNAKMSREELEAELALHPDARKPLAPAFEGPVNPVTGEENGPKIEPVRRWTKEDEGDWSYKGRVSDF